MLSSYRYRRFDALVGEKREKRREGKKRREEGGTIDSSDRLLV